MTFLKARSVAPGDSSASTSRAMSMNRRDCSGSSALRGGRGLRSGIGDSPMTRVDASKFMFVGGSPELLAAFEVILGERAIPPDIDSISYLRYCSELLRSAMDQAHTRFANRGLPDGPEALEQPKPCHLESALGKQEVSLDVLSHHRCVSICVGSEVPSVPSPSLPGRCGNPRIADGEAGVIPPPQASVPIVEDQ